MSLSATDPPGDVPLLINFLDLGERVKKDASSSTVVAVEELDEWENFIKLPSLVVDVYVEERLAVDFVRRLLFMDPAKKSPIAEAGREVKRFLGMASSPKMDTLDRAVGVEGLELRPVRNSKRPN